MSIANPHTRNYHALHPDPEIISQYDDKTINAEIFLIFFIFFLNVTSAKNVFSRNKRLVLPESNWIKVKNKLKENMCMIVGNANNLFLKLFRLFYSLQ